MLANRFDSERSFSVRRPCLTLFDNKALMCSQDHRHLRPPCITVQPDETPSACFPMRSSLPHGLTTLCDHEVNAMFKRVLDAWSEYSIRLQASASVFATHGWPRLSPNTMVEFSTFSLLHNFKNCLRSFSPIPGSGLS